MIERRKEPRFRQSLPVRVSGIYDEGQPFSVEVTATSLSQNGALLTGLEVELRCGDMLMVEYEGRRANFRIVWVLNLGPRRGAEVAVHKPNHQACPWADVLAVESASETVESQ
jgi:hypothetical protein